MEVKGGNKLIFCPNCHSSNLSRGLLCPKCGSQCITKSRILEHFPCVHVDLEDKFMVEGKYICPKCAQELKFLGTDYLSLGVVQKCLNCNEIFSKAINKWHCLKCFLFFDEEEAEEIITPAYPQDEAQRQYFESILTAKSKFIDFLKAQGYQVTEKNSIKGKVGTDHTFDIIALRNDGLTTHILGIDILISEQDKEVELTEVFRFDSKAYDAGIHDKVLLVFPKLSPEAFHFAQRQRIKVFTIKELEAFSSSTKTSSSQRISYLPRELKTKAQFVQKLVELGYKVQEKAEVKGKSGVCYTLDIMAEWDDGIIIHSVGIDILTSQDEVGLEPIALFDTKAYDIGIHQKVVLVAPKLGIEAKRFAQRQGIKVFKVKEAAKLAC